MCSGVCDQNHGCVLNVDVLEHGVDESSRCPPVCGCECVGCDVSCPLCSVGVDEYVGNVDVVVIGVGDVVECVDSGFSVLVAS